MYTKFGGDAYAIDLARKCLSEPGEQLEPLLIYQFQDDVVAHDDELQDHLKVEFEGEWKRATAEIALEFGEATIAILYDETEYVPLNGVYGASSWQIGKKRLFVAYAHEDRETPYLLVVGTVQGCRA
jgi:hypothetical protein